MGCRTKDVMEKRDGAFVFEKNDLKIDLDDPEKDVCLIPYRPYGDGEEFYMHKTKNNGRQFYRLHFGADRAKFEGIDKEHIAIAVKDEEIKHDTIITQDQLDLLGKYGIKLASICMSSSISIIYIIDGEITVITKEKTYTATKGSYVNIPIRQAECSGEFALSEALRDIIAEEQDHEIDLKDALG